MEEEKTVKRWNNRCGERDGTVEEKDGERWTNRCGYGGSVLWKRGKKGDVCVERRVYMEELKGQKGRERLKDKKGKRRLYKERK